MAINLTITEENEPPISVMITEGIGVPTGGGSTPVIDNLTSTSATSALSANQGRVLNEGKASTASVTTVASNLTTHENDTTNPHNVSASQVGLGNVENTALSTWTGNTSITSLGTISVGTWQGTAIADAYIASAATWNAKAAGTVVADYIGAASTITYAATITPDAANGRSQKIGALTGGITVNVPTNLDDGQSMTLRGLQDGTGGRSLSLGAGFVVMAGTTASVAALTANKRFRLTIVRDGSTYEAFIAVES